MFSFIFLHAFLFQFGSVSFHYYPFVMHGFLVSLFSSLIGPFGGFLASGLKRACKRKVCIVQGGDVKLALISNVHTGCIVLNAISLNF